MNNRTLFLHVGYPKTATTFLQKVILPKISSLECFALPSIIIDDSEPISFSSIFHSSPEIWGDIGYRFFSELFDTKNKNQTCKQNILVSDEGMTGGLIAPNPWIPRHSKGYLPPARPHQGYGEERKLIFPTGRTYCRWTVMDHILLVLTLRNCQR